jgi:lysophospholipase L1-like esterase
MRLGLFVGLLFLTTCGRVTPRKPVNRIIAFGDSHSEGSSGLHPGEKGFVRLLADAVSVPFINRAYGGSKISTRGQMPDVLAETDLEGAAVVYLTGYNDMRWGRQGSSWPYYRADLERSIRHLKEVGAARILIGNCLRMQQKMYVDLSATPEYGVNFNYGSDEAVFQINRVIADVVAREGAELVDTNAVIDPELDSSWDNIHLSQRGHNKISEAFRAALVSR